MKRKDSGAGGAGRRRDDVIDSPPGKCLFLFFPPEFHDTEMFLFLSRKSLRTDGGKGICRQRDERLKTLLAGYLKVKMRKDPLYCLA